MNRLRGTRERYLARLAEAGIDAKPNRIQLTRDKVVLAESKAKSEIIQLPASEGVPARRIGEFVMDELRKLDHVGYVRFASVYRSFEDVADFREEIERLERDLPPGEGQLPLLQGGGVVSLERHADRLAERQKKR